MPAAANAFGHGTEFRATPLGGHMAGYPRVVVGPIPPGNKFTVFHPHVTGPGKAPGAAQEPELHIFFVS